MADANKNNVKIFISEYLARYTALFSRVSRAVYMPYAKSEVN